MLESLLKRVKDHIGKGWATVSSSGRIGIKDVARLAGVSQGTVSNVLNHPDRVKPGKREAVERAIEELGFVRHESARQLRAGYSSTIGMVLLDAWNPGFIDVAHGVEDATADQGMTVLISNSARDIEREKTYLRLFAEQRVAGVIVIPHDEYSEGLHRIRSGGMPVVVVDRAETGDGAMSVAVDDVAGGELAAWHLIELGHRHLAFVGDEALAIPVHDRLTGVRRAVAESGLDIRLDVLPSSLTAQAGREVGERLAAMPDGERPTGVTTAIDLVAVGLLQGLVQHGVRVPDDLSLVGYDDIPFALQLSVPLTTVRRPHYEMGVAAFQMLAAALTGETPDPRHLVFSPELVVRESTGPWSAGLSTKETR
jgi:LacI family transcriptional regulator